MQTVDFNGLRASIVQKFNHLVEDITLHQCKQVDGVMIEMPLEEMQKSIGELRSGLAQLIYLQNEDAGIPPLTGYQLQQLRPSTMLTNYMLAYGK